MTKLKIVCLIGFFALSVQVSIGQTEEEFLKRGADNADANRFDNAISDLTKCIGLYPKSSRCFFYRGGIYYFTKKYDLAIADYSQGISLDPKSFGGFYFRALAYESIEKYKEAMADLKMALDLKPNDADAVEALAKTKPLYAKQLSKEGWAIYVRAVDLKEEADIAKAETLYREAIAKYTSAIELDPDVTSYYFERAGAYRRLGKLEMAISDLSEVMKRKKILNAWHERAELHIELRMFDIAIKDLTEAIAFEEPKNYPPRSKAYSYVLRGRAYLGKAKTDLALVDLNKAVELNGWQPSGYYYRGLIHLARKDRQAAIADFKAVLERDTKHEEAADALKKLGVNPE